MTSQPSQDLHNRGWGFALLIIGIAIIVNATAFAIHKATYLRPDHRAPSSGAAR